MTHLANLQINTALLVPRVRIRSSTRKPIFYIPFERRQRRQTAVWFRRNPTIPCHHTRLAHRPITTIPQEALQTEEFAQQRPPAHDICDVDGGRAFADMPYHVDSGIRVAEVIVFIQDRCEDDEGAETEDGNKEAAF